VKLASGVSTRRTKFAPKVPVFRTSGWCRSALARFRLGPAIPGDRRFASSGVGVGVEVLVGVAVACPSV
jgi:hypothetical protein